jgi:hypothetical protein
VLIAMWIAHLLLFILPVRMMSPGCSVMNAELDLVVELGGGRRPINRGLVPTLRFPHTVVVGAAADQLLGSAPSS